MPTTTGGPPQTVQGSAGPGWRLGLGASLALALVYSLWVLHQGLQNPNIIQDDARQHVFWMQRFLDPGLFPQDPIADYFQSVAPWGYAQLYRGAAALGISPSLMSKLLPTALGLVMTGFCYGLVGELLPVAGAGPLAGVLASWLLNQNLWLQDGIVSGTPKAFLYPTLLGFLYFFVRRSLWPCLLLLLLQALFYPLTVFLSAGLLAVDGLAGWLSGGRADAGGSGQRDRLRFNGIAIALAIAVLLPYALRSSEFGPVITAAQARTLPEFFPGGRSAFFNDAHPWDFWLNDGRSGLRLASALRPDGAYAALLLPLLLRIKSIRQSALGRSLRHLSLLPQLLLASLGWFLLAHGLLFRLHLPSRYSQHSLKMVVVVAAALAWVLLLDAGQTWLAARLRTGAGRRLGRWVSVALLLVWVLLVPWGDPKFPRSYNVQGNYPALYGFLQAQPRDIVIASLSEAANNLPSFAQRSILVGSEYAIPYHWGYYQGFRERAIATLTAQYSPDLEILQGTIRQYGIDFWLLDAQSFNPEALTSNAWLRAFGPPMQRPWVSSSPAARPRPGPMGRDLPGPPGR
ncbi:MAG: hypothetical protein HC824_01645 [Synechococcales cyanobacterium RM1_1_8]|nr:hypothetical protein [Synechococcales cyanobacterium RM1_1_8]